MRERDRWTEREKERGRENNNKGVIGIQENTRIQILKGTLFQISQSALLLSLISVPLFFLAEQVTKSVQDRLLQVLCGVSHTNPKLRETNMFDPAWVGCLSLV